MDAEDAASGEPEDVGGADIFGSVPDSVRRPLLALLQQRPDCPWNARRACKALRNLVDAHATHMHLQVRSDTGGRLPPPPLERWECVTELTLELDPWVTDDDTGVTVEAGPLAALPFVGTPQSARQRITKLNIVTPNPMYYVVPAVAISSLALYLPCLKELHLRTMLYTGDHMTVHAHQMYGALALGMPCLEALTLPSAEWLVGVEALTGLRRLTVTVPPNDVGNEGGGGGWLYEAGARSVGMLSALEELVIAENWAGSLGEFYILLDVLPASLQHLCIRGPNDDSGLDGSVTLELRMGGRKRGNMGDTCTGGGGGYDLSSGPSDLVARDFEFSGDIEVLVHVAHQLLSAGRLGPRVTRLRLRNLVVGPHSLAASEVPDPEGVLWALRSGCEAVQFRRLALMSGMYEQEEDEAAIRAQEEEGLGMALKAAQLFGRPARIHVSCGSFDLDVDTSALGAEASPAARVAHHMLWTEAARAGPSPGAQLPGAGALLDAAIQRLLEAGRGKPLAEAREAGTRPGRSMRSTYAVLLAHGSVVSGVAGDGEELVLELAQVISTPAPPRHHMMAWLLLPASAALLAVPEAAVERVKEAVEALAERMVRDVEVVRIKSARHADKLCSVVPLAETVQSALDDAAAHLAIETCLEWLHGIKVMVMQLPSQVMLG